jgi:hypothetical protein
MMRGDLETRAIERARRSIRSLPFRRLFYQEVELKSMNSSELVEREDWEKLVFVPFGRERAEEHFEWMIKLGILRREVDGQGLTNRVRLTPFGGMIIRQWKGEIPRSGIRERIKENFYRHGIRG